MKRCVICNQYGEFETARIKTCIRCKEMKLLKKEKLKQERRIARLEKKKQKTKAIDKISDLKKRVQTKVNKYVRDRDKGLPCISCGKYFDEYQAGHFISQGSSGFLRYNLDNINCQCVGCNKWKHGNGIEYRIALVQKIGVERVEWLEAHRHDTKHWTREELEEVVNKLPVAL
jgi:hypothetical protein